MRKLLRLVLADVDAAAHAVSVPRVTVVALYALPPPPYSRVYTLRYQGELLGLWDPQNRDLRQKLPPETKFSVG